MSMDASFGRIRDKDNKTDLFKAENGILWCTEAEHRVSKAARTRKLSKMFKTQLLNSHRLC